MLRRPSAYHPTRRGEGCSSTAFGRLHPGSGAVWNNLANRGSAACVATSRPIAVCACVPNSAAALPDQETTRPSGSRVNAARSARSGSRRRGSTGGPSPFVSDSTSIGTKLRDTLTGRGGLPGHGRRPFTPWRLGTGSRFSYAEKSCRGNVSYQRRSRGWPQTTPATSPVSRFRLTPVSSPSTPDHSYVPGAEAHDAPAR